MRRVLLVAACGLALAGCSSISTDWLPGMSLGAAGSGSARIGARGRRGGHLRGPGLPDAVHRRGAGARRVHRDVQPPRLPAADDSRAAARARPGHRAASSRAWPSSRPTRCSRSSSRRRRPRSPSARQSPSRAPPPRLRRGRGRRRPRRSARSRARSRPPRPRSARSPARNRPHPPRPGRRRRRGEAGGRRGCNASNFSRLLGVIENLLAYPSGLRRR